MIKVMLFYAAISKEFGIEINEFMIEARKGW